jgi:predicted DNA-binding ribbon-helix-helix protein
MLEEHCNLIGGRKPNSALISRSITISGRRTSIRLEPGMWNGLNEICKREQLSINELCSLVNGCKSPRSSFTSTVRLFVLAYFRAAATEEGHVVAGHGGGGRKSVVEQMLIQ